MSIESWKPDFALDIPEIDDQHKGLFHVFDVLQESNAKGYGGDQLSVLFLEMLYYVRRHLRYEEGLLKRHGYPQLEEHRALHLTLEEQLHGFHTRYNESLKERDAVAREVGLFMSEWLDRHINVEDRKYSAFLHHQGVF